MINLEKGMNAPLQDMNMFYAGLGWDVNVDEAQEDFDLDVSAFMLGENKKVPNDNYMVFYNSELRVKPENLTKIVNASAWGEDNDGMRKHSRPVDPEISVIGSIDDEDGLTSEDGDDETMDFNLNKVRADVREIVICVSIYKWKERRQNFGQVERAYIRLYKPGQEAEGDGEFIYDLTEDFSACHSVEFCTLYRKDGGWKVKALGIGHQGGLEELKDKYVD